MPTTLAAKRRPATRGEADDLMIAQGQIALIDALTARLARVRDSIGRAFARP